jgi:energy-converting hydrogenase Eha subunit F
MPIAFVHKKKCSRGEAPLKVVSQISRHRLVIDKIERYFEPITLLLKKSHFAVSCLTNHIQTTIYIHHCSLISHKA